MTITTTATPTTTIQQPIITKPRKRSYDVVVIGGAMMGSSVAWFLSTNPDFDGSILVVERDPTYSACSTAHTNSCMRQQFSNEINIQISQFAAEFVKDFRSYMGDNPEVPEIATQFFGYMYLADTEEFAAMLRRNQALQARFSAGTRIMTPAQIMHRYPFYYLKDIVCGSHNLIDEGYWDGITVFDWWRRMARRSGVEYCNNEVVDITHHDSRVHSVQLRTGETVLCGVLVNAAGPRAVEVAAMAGFELPVEPRKRYTFVFDAAEPLEGDLPLTIDPSGVHVRSDGGYYLAGCAPDVDHAVAYDDFVMDDDVWEEKVWPTIAHRIPAFERIKLINSWAGHYAYNTFDHNVIVGPHHEVGNFLFLNGFSGHGLQQSPAVGRGVSEWITYGEYRSLDLTPLGYHRVVAGEPFAETAVI